MEHAVRQVEDGLRPRVNGLPCLMQGKPADLWCRQDQDRLQVEVTPDEHLNLLPKRLELLQDRRPADGMREKQQDSPGTIIWPHGERLAQELRLLMPEDRLAHLDKCLLERGKVIWRELLSSQLPAPQGNATGRRETECFRKACSLGHVQQFFLCHIALLK